MQKKARGKRGGGGGGGWGGPSVNFSASSVISYFGMLVVGTRDTYF